MPEIQIRPFSPIDARSMVVPLIPVDSEMITHGMPRVGTAEILTLGAAAVGVWEMTAGGMRDIEVDELFVVIGGSATVTLLGDEKEERSIRLEVGDVCRLTAGMTTTWDVPSFIRKVYVLAGGEGGDE